MHRELMYAHARALTSERLRATARHTPPGYAHDVGCPVSGRLRLQHLLHTFVGEPARLARHRFPSGPGRLSERSGSISSE
jgi:hypothetical protein